jgi:UDP-N-acetyl-2-amino-2-deoxyglucuronate dehydrogenase
MLKYAIIGCGAIASRHARQAVTSGKLLAVCDIVEEKALGLAKEYQAKAYTRIGDLLQAEKEVDVVAICTPNGLHAEHSILALRAGFHVLCEKPMSLHSSDCGKMIREAEKAGRHLFVVKQNRFNPPVTAVKKLLDEDELGRIYSVQVNCCWNRSAGYYADSWHGKRELDGGILFTQFSHFIDLLYWMMGEVKDVTAYVDNFAHKGIVEFEDTVVACLRFENGIIGSLHFTINSYQKNMEGAIIIAAEKGTLKIGGQYLNTLEYFQGATAMPEKLPPGNLFNDYGTYQGSMSNHDKIYGHVADVIEKDYPNQFGGTEGLKTVEIIEKIYEAAK